MINEIKKYAKGMQVQPDVHDWIDKHLVPHCTMEKDQQIKGKGNGAIHPKYIGYIVKFLEIAGMQVGDNEMLNLDCKPLIDESGDFIEADDVY